MNQPQNRLRWIILVSVVASRLVYAISWFDISAAPLAIIKDFGVDQIALGALGSAFILGVGLFQIPAGGLATRWSAKNTALFGLLIMALAGIGSGLAPTFLLLIIARFAVGLGAAFFFAPAIGIITPLFSSEEKGFVIGVYNGAFGIGAGIGLFGWEVIDSIVGWRIGLMIAGVVTVLLAVENFVVIRKDDAVNRVVRGSVRLVIRNRQLWFWAVGLLGFWGALFIASSFLEHYGETQLALGGFAAALLAGSINFVAVLGGPIGGRLSDHFRSRKLFMFIPGVAFGLGIMTIGFLSLPVLWVIPIGLGFIDGFIFASLYASPSQLPEVGTAYAPLAIGLINGIQILGSFWMPLIFAFLAQTSGYPSAWIFLGIATIVLLPLIVFTKEPFMYEITGQDSRCEETLN